ncbi:DAO-domain-containing protein [Myriangium duriaei CBS 260.36]|uniref:DAO-domain-containing protein n=1 Tax=Myriangium duriaei CBS 260.36 TaxID=1168546 RepID=A0A9P4J1K2_9PEZI|nr:DAO-domain-containing protein [Myriangium duriaei CBS 260.36]
MTATMPTAPSALPHPNPTASFWHTSPSSLLSGHRSTRSLPSRASVVVVGAGITGASVAWHLLREQTAPQVLLLEAREVCWGATGRNGGHCQPLLFKHPLDAEIGRFELLNHATIAQLAGTPTFPCEFVTQPSVHAFFSAPEAAAQKAKFDALKATDTTLSSHCEWVTDAARLAELRVPDAHAAVVTDVAARVWPYKFVAGVVEDLLLDAEIGAKFNLQTHTPVTKLERGDGEWTVVTERGKVRAKHVVLATNGYTSHLLPAWADLIVPCRGQMSALAPNRELADRKRLTTSYGFDGGVQDGYLIQRDNENGGQLMFGGGGQYGNRIGNADDSVVDPKLSEYLTSQLPVIFATKDKAPLQPQQIWTGVMGYSRDALPHVGPVLGKEGLFIAAGFTGHGMPNTWLSGRAVAEMVAAIAKGEDVKDAVEQARKATMLPKSYLLTRERLLAARLMPTVLEQDRANSQEAGLYRG